MKRALENTGRIPFNLKCLMFPKGSLFASVRGLKAKQPPRRGPRSHSSTVQTHFWDPWCRAFYNANQADWFNSSKQTTIVSNMKIMIIINVNSNWNRLTVSFGWTTNIKWNIAQVFMKVVWMSVMCAWVSMRSRSLFLLSPLPGETTIITQLFTTPFGLLARFSGLLQMSATLNAN